jgi:hypothetical protein
MAKKKKLGLGPRARVLELPSPEVLVPEAPPEKKTKKPKHLKKVKKYNKHDPKKQSKEYTLSLTTEPSNIAPNGNVTRRAHAEEPIMYEFPLDDDDET